MAQEIVRGCPSTMGDDFQLNTTTLIRHAARTHGDQTIVFRTANGGWDRTTYADTYRRICKAAAALRRLGIAHGDRVGVLDWNSLRHYELYWAIPGLAAVMLQMNLRLGPEDLGYVVQHSNASYIAVDETLLPIAEAIAPHAGHVKGWIVMTDKPLSEIKTALAPIYHYEDMVAAEASTFDWPMVDERSAYSACYTTGTTGRPKGVYYSHRAIYLHAMAMAASLGVTFDDCAMLITPMFHGNCWGLPQAITLMANKIVLPGRYTAEDTGPLTDAMIREGVTIANGAPAIFQPMLEHIRTKKLQPDFSRMRLLSGATEPPLAMMRGFFDETGAEVVHAYGATETTPLVAVNRFKRSVREKMNDDQLWDLKRKQGLPMIGIDIELLDENDKACPHDGAAAGEICLRGPWIITRYHDMPDGEDRFTTDGYWRSGDAGSIDTNGYLKLTDRIKDVIKSGGEWISSIDMENLIMAHPAVLEAAVVGVPHAKWQERPVAVVVLRAGAQLTADALREHLSPQFAKWQLPEKIVFTDKVARTSVGKADKKSIRAEYQNAYAGEDA